MEFGEVFARMFSGVERRFETKLSATKTRSPTVVLAGDPQSIKYLSAGLNPLQRHNKDNMIETQTNDSKTPQPIIKIPTNYSYPVGKGNLGFLYRINRGKKSWYSKHKAQI